MAPSETSPLQLATPHIGNFFIRPDKKKGNGNRVRQVFDAPMIQKYMRCITGLKNPRWLDSKFFTVDEAWEKVRKTHIIFAGGDSLPFETVLELFDPNGYKTLTRAVNREKSEKMLSAKRPLEDYLANTYDSA